ncbi:MAG: glutaredoxin family protein [Chloroflexota bacterium]|nr:glutaredoxin family protein [Chloroflexota bacterium]
MEHHIVLYGKPDCHLCDIAHQLLLGLQREFEMTIEEIDITRDPALLDKYREAVPVLLIDNRTTLAAPIRTAEVRAALNL